jgi:hypothetical protein
LRASNAFWMTCKATSAAFLVWIAIHSVWAASRLPEEQDGTPLFSFVLVVLWPLSIVMAIVAIRDIRGLRKGTLRGGPARALLMLEIAGCAGGILSGLLAFLL